MTAPSFDTRCDAATGLSAPVSLALPVVTIAPSPISASTALLAPPAMASVVTPVTVVVPTRNEVGNVATLVARLAAVLPPGRARIVFVDDSDDGTPAEVTRIAATSGIDVQLIHRPGGNRPGGLGGAVLRGFASTQSPWVVVMDADLQHPPEVVPGLVARAEALDADVVVASRHVPGGDASGLSGVVRALVSRSSILASKLLFPHRLDGVSDPMSGFFVVRRSRIDLTRLQPDGFKILLETLARHGDLVKAEVPFVFGERHSGDSKASLREGLVFMRQLLRLRLALSVSRSRPGVLRRALGFASVGASGLLVNSLVLWLLVAHTAVSPHYLLAAMIATQFSSSWNFALLETLVYRGPKRGRRLLRYGGFLGMSNSVLVIRMPLLAALVGLLGVHYLLANALTLLLGFLVRFGTHERLTLMENTSV